MTMKKLLAALLLCVSTSTALAQDEERARELFGEGVEALQNEEWERARTLFEEAYELAPRVSVLTNLATAQAQSGQLVEALASYETLLDDPPDRRTRRRLRTIVRELRPRIPTLTVRVIGGRPRDELLIDGDVVAANDPVTVNPGWRQVEVQREGEVVAAARVRVDEGAQEEAELEVRVPTPAEVAAAQPIERIEAPDPIDVAVREPEEEEGGSKTWLWVTLAVVGAAAVGATVAIVALSGGGEDRFVGNVAPGTADVR